jgi:hypothetical protein
MAKLEKWQLWVAAVVVGAAMANAQSAQAQPYRCGGRVPGTQQPGCHWECVGEAFGGSKVRPPQQRYVWKQICQPGVVGPPAGGPAEIHKKNVPTVRKNHNPGPNN